MILVAYVSSRALGLFTLNWILDNFLGSIILVIIVIFQSDIRRALTQVGTAPLFGTAERMVQPREDIIDEVAQAAVALAAQARRRADRVPARSRAQRIHGNRHAARRPGQPRADRKRVLCPIRRFTTARW